MYCKLLNITANKSFALQKKYRDHKNTIYIVGKHNSIIFLYDSEEGLTSKSYDLKGQDFEP